MRKLLLFLLCSPALAQVNIQGAGIQIGGLSATTGVSSFNISGSPALTNAILFACGSGLTCSQSGQTITINLSAAFSITGFTGCSTVELGTSLVNPTFIAGYTATPASAAITNTNGASSPFNLTTPFTSGTIPATFTYTSTSSVTFTLNATSGSTQTASCVDYWKPAIFGGVGATGATSSVTASGTTAVLSTGTVLARAQLGAETVGQAFGPFAPSSQVIYLLLTGGSHTFIDALTGFPFAFNAPITVTYVNAQGTTVTMYLYQSTNPLYGTYQPKVTS
jgi:hypothetical protein